jgi:hypothetical protein
MTVDMVYQMELRDEDNFSKLNKQRWQI